MPGEALMDYLKKQKQRGFSDEELVQYLVSSGHAEADVRAALASLASPAQAPAASAPATPPLETIAPKRHHMRGLIIAFVVIAILVIAAGAYYVFLMPEPLPPYYTNHTGQNISTNTTVPDSNLSMNVSQEIVNGTVNITVNVTPEENGTVATNGTTNGTLDVLLPCSEIRNITDVDPSGPGGSSFSFDDGEWKYWFGAQDGEFLNARVESKSTLRSKDNPYKNINFRFPRTMDAAFPLMDGYGLRIINETTTYRGFSTSEHVYHFEFFNASRPGCDPDYTEEPVIALACDNSNCVFELAEEVVIGAEVNYPFTVQESAVAVSVDGDDPLLVKEIVVENTIRPRNDGFYLRLPHGSLAPGVHDVLVEVTADGRSYQEKFPLDILPEDEVAIPYTERWSASTTEEDHVLRNVGTAADGTIELKHNNYADSLFLARNACIDIPDADGSKAFSLCYPHRTITHLRDTPVFRASGLPEGNYAFMDDLVDEECKVVTTLEVGDDVEIKEIEYELIKIYGSPSVVLFNMTGLSYGDGDALHYAAYGAYATPWFPFGVSVVSEGRVTIWYEDCSAS